MAEPGLVAAARARGQAVLAWTANTASMMRRALDAGVDAVVTNHAAELQAAIAARLAACEARAAAGEELR